MPIGAFLARRRSGAGISCRLITAAPLAVIRWLARRLWLAAEAMEEEGLLDNANKLGQLLQDKLRQLAQKYPGVITTVRGRGLIVGAELAGQGRGIVEACLEKGVIITAPQATCCGSYRRLISPRRI